MEAYLPNIEEEEKEEDYESLASPHLRGQGQTPFPEGDDPTSSKDHKADDDNEYDTDIEITPEVAPLARRPEDAGIGEVDYKRSCSRLNIPTENKIAANLNNVVLELKYQGLGEPGAKALAKSLQKNSKVEKLDLEDNSITPLGVTFLCDMMCDNIYITYLDLSKNDVGTFGSMALKEMLVYSNTILHLILKDCKIKDSDCVVLAEGIQLTESLRYLDLSHNELCEDGAMCLGNAIGINNSIEQLSLAWNHIRRRGAVQICKGLKRNYCLLKVDLSWNGLAYDGALALGQTLKVNKYIRELDVSCNRFEWNSAATIAVGLKENYTLEVLKIGLNPLTMTGVLDILNAVNTKHCEIEYLSFEACPINRKIAYLAERISNQREFSISHGGVIDTEDVLGQKKVEEDDPLNRLLSFLYDRSIRPVELFRSFEKGKDNLVSREQFISGLKKAQCPLETWEIVKVMEVLDKNEEGMINYRKLNSGFQEKKINNKKKELKEKAEARKKIKDERKILNPDFTPSTAETLKKSSITGSLANSLSSGSRRTSRLSLSLSQSNLDVRKQSAISIISGRSGAVLNTPPNPALVKIVNAKQSAARLAEVSKKISRVGLE